MDKFDIFLEFRGEMKPLNSQIVNIIEYDICR